MAKMWPRRPRVKYVTRKPVEEDEELEDEKEEFKSEVESDDESSPEYERISEKDPSVSMTRTQDPDYQHDIEFGNQMSATIGPDQMYHFNNSLNIDNNFIITSTTILESQTNQNDVTQMNPAQPEIAVHEVEVESYVHEATDVLNNDGKQMKSDRVYAVGKVKGKIQNKKRKLIKNTPKDLDPQKVKNSRIKKPGTRRKRKKEKPVPAICHLCGHFANSRTSMYYHHMNNHEKTKRYVCTVCGKNFCQAVALKLHTRIHTGEKPFSCHICQRKFTQRGSLKSHQIVHTGEKNHQCEICAQCFSFKASLVRHRVRAHSEKPIQLFPCPDCNKLFRHRGFLKTHEQLVHQPDASPKPTESLITDIPKEEVVTSPIESQSPQLLIPLHRCDMCPSVFATRIQLYRHDRKFHPHVRPYACFKCPQRFADSAEAKVHFLNAHGITVHPLGSTNVKKSTNNVSTNSTQVTNYNYNKNVGHIDDQKEDILIEGHVKDNIGASTLPNSIVKKNRNEHITGRQNTTKVLIVRKKTEGLTIQSDSNSKPCEFSNLLTLASVSSLGTPKGTLTLTPVSKSDTLKITNTQIASKHPIVLDTITIDESPVPSPTKKELEIVYMDNYDD